MFLNLECLCFKKHLKSKALFGNNIWQYFAKCYTILVVFAHIEDFELHRLYGIWKIKFLQKTPILIFCKNKF